MRNSLFSFASKIAPYIVRRKPFISWFNTRSDGLGGLRDLIRSKALIDKACRRRSFSVAGIFSIKFRLDSLPRLGGGGWGSKPDIELRNNPIGFKRY